MQRLSSHPLPPEVLRLPALRYIYETTPPTPRTAPVAPARRSDRTVREPEVSVDQAPVETRVVFGERFLVERPIDSGGTATIFLARDLVTGEERAVKLLTEQAASDPHMRNYFLEGARAAMGISHPNVVRVLSVHDPDDGRPYAVMELLKGEPLHVTLARHERLPAEVVIPLARGAARGLAAAHAAGIVHCDVKPENLYIVETGHAHNIKILDFDLAWVPRTEPVPPERKGRLLLRGTAKYMAPEQIVCDPVDPRTDVYGLGVVLFRLITGHVPFDLELGAQLLRHHLWSPVPPPSWLVDNLDPRLDAVVVRATRKAPANRYADMGELLADLDAIAFDRELVSSPGIEVVDQYSPQSDEAREAVRALGSAA